MRTVVCGEGQNFRLEVWSRSLALFCKCSGRYAVLTGATREKFYDAISQAPAHVRGDADALYGWIWTNAGFHRLAS